MTVTVAVDTSMAIPLLASTHDHHDRALRGLDTRTAVLSGHALVETYSVLTRLKGEIRQPPAEAVRLIEARFGDPVLLDESMLRRVPTLLADADIAGGAVYDGLVGLAAREHDLVLLTRDGRAMPTYDALGVAVEFVA